EAFPSMYPNLGPDVTAAYMGCDLVFGETTSWSVPNLPNWDGLAAVRFDPANEWWQRTVAMTQAMLDVSSSDANGHGGFVVGITDLHTAADTAAAMRDPQQFCLDLIESPAQAKELLAMVQPLFGFVYHYLAAMVRPVCGGTSTWLPDFTAGRYYPISNDFSCMVSPGMFEEFFVDSTVADARLLDHVLYHLDGPDAIKHLDRLLEIPEIHGIQWVPGQREPSPLQWIPLLQRIQATGRRIDVSLDAAEVLPLLDYLSPRGLLLRTGCASEEEARALLAAAERRCSR
ncbi:MAG: hypothetical protein ACYC5O_18810, partial [Anaerolineae bacterium]